MDGPILHDLFTRQFGASPECIAALQRHASPRRLYRLSGRGQTAIGVCHDDVNENRTFVGLSRHFLTGGLPVPMVYRVSDDETAYLVEDLGTETLFEYLQRSRTEDDRCPAAVEACYHEAVTTLPRFQMQRPALTIPPYDAVSMRADLHYFQNSFVARFNLQVDGLEQEFDGLVHHLSSAPASYFMYRDFQARNIMVGGERFNVSFIDYQGGRLGPLQYDVVSLLYQTRSDLPDDTRRRLLAAYLDALDQHSTVSHDEFLYYLPGFVVIRLLQTLGTYGKIGLGQRHEDFITIIPRTLRALADQLAGAVAVHLDGIRRVIDGAARQGVSCV